MSTAAAATLDDGEAATIVLYTYRAPRPCSSREVISCSIRCQNTDDGLRFPQVREVLGSRNDSLKAVVLRQIVGEWPSDDVRGLSDQLFLIATDGQSWGADLLALRLLAQHRIGDLGWITGWLEFKREHHEKRLSEIAGILRMLQDRGAA